MKIVTTFIKKLPTFLQITLYGLICFWPLLTNATNNHPTRVSYLMSTAGIQADSIVELALHFKIDEPFHIYWKYPGKLGLPTKLNVELPTGFKTIEEKWSIPEEFIASDEVNYGYSKEAVIILRIKTPKILKKSNYTLKLKISWLNCDQEICLPDKDEHAVMLNSDGSALPKNTAFFSKWNSSFPVSFAEQTLLSHPIIQCTPSNTLLKCFLQLTPSKVEEEIYWLPNPIKPTKIKNLKRLNETDFSFTITHPNMTDSKQPNCSLPSLIVVNRANLSPIGIKYQIPIC